MKNIVICVVLLTISSHSFALIGGTRVSNGDAPGVLKILINVGGNEYKYKICTASKIGSKYILTAAHCVQGQNVSYIRWGNARTNLVNSPLKIKKVYIDPSFKNEESGQSHNTRDVAILEVDTSVSNDLREFEKIPVLQLDYAEVFSGERLKVYGYGCDLLNADIANFYKKMDIITAVAQNLITAKHPGDNASISHDASQIYKAHIVSTAIGNNGSSTLCVGDSGGPVLRGERIVGVNSQHVVDQEYPNEDPFLNLHSRLSKDWIKGIVDSN